jgi:hypothetical protein
LAPAKEVLEQREQEKKTKGRRRWIWVLAALFGLCILGTCTAVLLSPDDEEATDVAVETATDQAMGGEATATVVPTASETTLPSGPSPTLAPTDTPSPPTDTPVPTDTPIPTDTPLPTDTPVPTDTPIPTDTPVPTPSGIIGVGTHLVGTDIEPGIYVGMAGGSMLDSCYWARLSGLGGTLDELIANDNSVGLFYIEVLPSDRALETQCELAPINNVPPPDSFLTVLPPGTYLVGRDIEAGTYRGEAGADIMESCYWARLGGVTGELDDLLANDNATGQFFVEVQPSDFALQVACEVEKVQ